MRAGRFGGSTRLQGRTATGGRWGGLRSPFGPQSGVNYLSGFTISPETGGETALLDITLNPAVTTGDVWFIVALASATAPDGPNIVLGLDGDDAAAVWADTASAAAVNAFTGPIIGLDPEEDYIAYAVWFDGVDRYSLVARASFTTLSAPELPILGEFVRAIETGEARHTETDDERHVETAAPESLSGLAVTPIAGGTTASFEITTTVPAGGWFYAVVYLDTATEPTAAQIEAATDGDDLAAVWDSNFELSSIDDYIPGITGLTQNTGYKISCMVRYSVTPGDYSDVVTASFTSADAAPILTDLLVVPSGPETAIFTVTTDDISGSIKWGVFASAATPSKADILAGTGALDFGSIAVSATGLYQILDVTGLSASTAYKVHAYHVDAGALESAILTSSEFTTYATETLQWQTAHAGAATNLTGSTSGGVTTSLTGTQTDPFAGTNAILAAATPLGSGVTASVTRASFTYQDGMNRLSFWLKKGDWASSAAWVRVLWSGMAIGSSGFSINLVTGATATPNATVAARYPSPQVIVLDDGWIYVSLPVNLSTTAGADDVTGTVALQMASASSVGSIATAGLHQLYIYDFKATY